jgi:hypothetical protein
MMSVPALQFNSQLFQKMRSTMSVNTSLPSQNLTPNLNQLNAVPSPSPVELSNAQKLALWQESINHALSQRQSVSDLTSQSSQVADTLNPSSPPPTSSTTKEVIQATSSLDQSAGRGSLDSAGLDGGGLDAGGMIQYVEQEKLPEIPVEVEAFIKRVENMQDLAPREVVIADGTNESATPQYPSRPVVVLPLSQDDEKAGAWKSPAWSIRWLIEWSRKIIKIFAGKVIYREPLQT